MIFSYDPVAKEVEIDLEVGLPPLTLKAETPQVRYFGEGIVSMLMFEQHIELAFFPTPEDPASMTITPTGENRWVIKFFPQTDAAASPDGGLPTRGDQG